MMDNSLRKAAEMALEALESVYGKGERCEAAIKALREALDLQTAIERGTKAWADVPDATEWAEELRGYDTPEETPEVTPEVPCKTHPDAPHGFNRNASFDEDRYVWDCEFWEPDVDTVDMSEKRVHKTNKSINEPVAIVNAGMGGIEWLTEQLPDDTPLYAAPPKQEYQYEVVAEHADGTYTTKRIPKRQWVGLTVDEIWKCNKAETGSAVEFHICSAHQNVLDFAESIEAKLKDKNS